ncbi:MAG: hypothetical protein Q4D56_10855 [Bacteroides sp.]|nr:hypothetical protein [Bacteroides sp.]
MKEKETACTDSHSTKTETGKTSIVLPTGTVIVLGLAVLCIIFDLAEGLMQYVQDGNASVLRIVMRSLGLLGWATVEWYIVSKLLEYRKRNKKDDKE